MKKTLCAVLINYNQRQYILDAFESILKQTKVPDEIIIVDDGSSDGSVDILKKRLKNTRAKLLIKENGGASSARNFGIKNSRADYIAFLDGDDVWKKDKLDKQLMLFKNSKLNNLGVVYADYENINQEGKVITGDSFFKLDKRVRGKVYSHLLEGNKIAGSASNVLVKREVFKKTGLFDEDLMECEDWDMWLRISRFYSFEYCSLVLASIRNHKHNKSENKRRAFLNRVLLYKKHNIRKQKALNNLRIEMILFLIRDKNINLITQIRKAAGSGYYGHIKGNIKDWLNLSFFAFISLLRKKLQNTNTNGAR